MSTVRRTDDEYQVKDCSKTPNSKLQTPNMRLTHIKFSIDAPHLQPAPQTVTLDKEYDYVWKIKERRN